MRLAEKPALRLEIDLDEATDNARTLVNRLDEKGMEEDGGPIRQAILTVGLQDVDPDGLVPPAGLKIFAASSDHLVVDTTEYHGSMKVGTEISFQLNYSAVLGAMTSPFVSKMMTPPQVKRPVKIR